MLRYFFNNFLWLVILIKSDFIRAARTFVAGPSIALGLLTSSSTHAVNLTQQTHRHSSPPKVPIAEISIESFRQRVSEELPVISNDVSRVTTDLRNVGDGPPMLEDTVLLKVDYSTLIDHLSANDERVANQIRTILQQEADKSLKERPFKQMISINRGIQLLSIEELERKLIASTSNTLFLYNEPNADLRSGCILFLSSEPDELWRTLKADLGVAKSFLSPAFLDDKKFDRDHEARHCMQPQLASRAALKAVADSKNKDLEIMKTEIDADLSAVRHNKGNPELLNAVAHIRIIGDIDHNSAFEIWRYLDSIHYKTERHAYLSVPDLRIAYATLADVVLDIFRDSDFQADGAALYPAGDNEMAHFSSDLYRASRIGLASDRFKDSRVTLVAKEYVAAFEYFDRVFEGGFKAKVDKQLAAGDAEVIKRHRPQIPHTLMATAKPALP